MVPSSVKKSPTIGLSIAFKPVAVARRSMSAAASQKHATAKSPGTVSTLEAQQTEVTGAGAAVEPKRSVGVGLGFTTVVTEV